MLDARTNFRLAAVLRALASSADSSLRLRTCSFVKSFACGAFVRISFFWRAYALSPYTRCSHPCNRCGSACLSCRTNTMAIGRRCNSITNAKALERALQFNGADRLELSVIILPVGFRWNRLNSVPVLSDLAALNPEQVIE